MSTRPALRLPLGVLALSLVGCASGATRASNADVAVSPAGVASSSAPAPDAARCAFVADSTGKLPVTRLVLVKPSASPRLTVFPRDVRGGLVVVDFKVSPRGEFDPTSMHVNGSTDASFINDLRQVLAGSRFIPAKVGGCPAWGRGDYRLKSEVRRVIVGTVPG